MRSDEYDVAAHQAALGAQMFGDLQLVSADEIDEQSESYRAQGYIACKRLPDGTYAALLRLITTVSICMELNDTGFERRYCFNDVTECLHQWRALTGRDYEPTGWIAKR